MTLMPEIHDELVRAVRRRRRSRWPRAGFAVAGVAVVSGTAIAATGTWRPQLGSPGKGQPPLVSARSVPADHAELLAVLRRPQTDRDRTPLVQEALKLMRRENINGIHADAIRVLFQNPREIVVLVPVRRSGDLRFKPSVRRDVLCVWSASYSDAQTIKVRRKGRTVTRRRPAGFVNGWSGTCADTRSLRRSGIQIGTSPDGDGGLITSARDVRETRLRQTVLVPDGVARVSVRVRGGKTIEAEVRDNVYQFMSVGVPARLGVTWWDAAGKRIPGR